MNAEDDRHRAALEGERDTHVRAGRWHRAADCTRELSELAELAGDLDSALTLIRSAGRFCELAGPSATGDLYACKWGEAELLVDLDLVADAAQLWVDAAEIAMAGGAPDSAVAALDLAGGAYDSIGDQQQSDRAATAAVRAADDVADLGDQAVLDAAAELTEAGGGAAYAKHLQSIRSRAMSRGERAVDAECTRLLAFIDWRGKRTIQAQNGFDRARSILVDLGSWSSAADAAENAGLVAADRGDLPGCADRLRLAVELADGAGDEQSAGHCAAVLGRCLYELRDWTGAAECLDRAAAIAAAGGQVLEAATLLHDLAQCLMRLGDPDAALEALRRATQLDDPGAEGISSRAWSEISSISRDLGRSQQAWGAAIRAVETAVDDETRRVGRFQQMMLSVADDPTPGVMEGFRQLRDEFAVASDLDRAFACDIAIGESAFARGDIAEAERRWTGAEAHFTEVDNDEMLARLYAAQGNRYGAARSVDLAIACFRRAQQRFKRAGLLADARACADNLIRLTSMQGPPPDFRSPEAGPPIITSRADAAITLGQGIVEINFRNFGLAAELLGAAMRWFDENGMTEEALESRLALATAEVARGNGRRSADLAAEVLLRTATGGFPRARGGALVATARTRIAADDLQAAAALLHEAVEVLSAAGAPAQAAQAQLDLAVLAAVAGDPEDALRHGRFAAARFAENQQVDLTARAELVCAMALSRQSAWQTAFGVATPAMLVIDLIRSGMTSSKDRTNWRDAWSWAQETVLRILAELDDPRLAAELIERLRGNAAPAATRDSAEQGLAAWLFRATAPLAQPAAVDPSPSQWSAGDAALGDDLRIAVTPPPVLRMPWGDALGPYERLAAERIRHLSARHQRARQTVVWAEQIGFV